MARADRVYIGSRVAQASSFPGDVDDCRVYNRVLTEVEIVELALSIADVTGPNTGVQGVPNDGDWPGAEAPDLAIDDNIGTKYLHFKGEVEPTGFRVAPAVGSTVVTGLTFTTANDAEARDPVTYELSGSNESLDGPYELIASGEIVDFAQAAAIPCFNKNATAIMFENAVGYTYYQVMFPTVRDAASANSMQIAEVELLGEALPLITSVVRTNGTSGDRDRIGAFDGGSAPLPMVAGGLADGVPVFSDRTYTWGGVPAEYVGTEYIATF